MDQGSNGGINFWNSPFGKSLGKLQSVTQPIYDTYQKVFPSAPMAKAFESLRTGVPMTFTQEEINSYGQGMMGNLTPIKAPTNLLLSHEGAPDLQRVAKYKADIQAGKPIEPIKVIREGSKYGIEDGKHRFQAFKELGIKDVPVEIVSQPKGKIDMSYLAR